MPTIPDLRHRSVTQFNIAANAYNGLIDCVYEGASTRPPIVKTIEENMSDFTIKYIQDNIAATNAILPEIHNMSDYINGLLSKANEVSDKLKTIGV